MKKFFKNGKATATDFIAWAGRDATEKEIKKKQ